MKAETTNADARPYRPYGAALDLFKCQDREILIEGPAGTGKTRAILEKLNAIASKHADVRILIVRKTRKSMTESVLVTFEEKVLPVGSSVLSGPTRGFRNAYDYPNGSTIVCGGLDHAERLYSTEFDVVAVFEAIEITEDEWEKFHRALRNEKMPYQQQIADTNPGTPTHWLNQRANTHRMTRLLSRFKDNPTISDTYLKGLSDLTGVRRDRLYLGRWAAAEGAVWPEYDADKHLIQRREIPDDWRRFRSIDFGYAVDHPFCCQWWAMDESGRLYRYRELYGAQRTVHKWAKQIMELSDNEVIEFTVCDHDAEDRATLAEEGIPVTPADKRVITGIETVAVRLANGTLFLLRDSLVERDTRLAEMKRPCCTEEEIDGYVWKVAPDGALAKEAPDKNSPDHGCDAMRYMVLWLDRKSLASVTVLGAGMTRADERQEQRDERGVDRDWLDVSNEALWNVQGEDE